MMKNAGGGRGFTLLELLVVIALMGVATSMGMVMLSGVWDAWNSTSARVSLDDRAAYIFDQMRQDFAEALSANLSGASIQAITRTAQGNVPGSGAVADDQVVIPVELASVPNALPQRADIGYAIERKDGACALMRTARLSDNPASRGNAPVSSVKVADGVLAMRVECLGRAPGDTWQPQWSKPVLPGAVRVSIVVIDPDRPYEQTARKAVFPIETE